MLLPISGCCGGGFGGVASFVDSMRICSASFSPGLVGSHGHGSCRSAVFRLFSPGTPPFWPNLLDKIAMLWRARSGGIGIGDPGGVFQLGMFTINPVIVLVVPAPF